MKNNNFVIISAFLMFLVISCKNEPQKNKVEYQKKVESVNTLSAFDSLNMKIQNHPSDPLLYNKRANFFLVSGDRNKALSDVNKALQLDTLNADIWVTLADVYFQSERFVDSREILLKAINLDPQNTSALLKLARLYFIYREYKTAMGYINTALKIDPMLEDAYFIKGMAYAEGGDTTRALFNYQKAVDVNAEFYDAWIELGSLNAAQGNSLAEQYYKNAWNLDTNNTHAQYILALYYQENNQLEKAIHTYQFLLEKEENKNALFNLGYVNLVYLEDYKEAIIYFQRVLNLDENYHDALFNLAYALELSGDKEDARLKYKELLQKVPNHEQALERLNILD
jgi:tetratricopeptide (TPR) repeat protein